MTRPPIPANESERLQRLKSFSLLDTLPEAEFDDITRIAAEICDTPIALVSLIDEDRQWFKSRHGLEAAETARDLAFCAHAINAPNELFEVKDATQDERFADNPLVTSEPNVIFYAGVPLVTDDGYALGTLCVIDHAPKALNDSQKSALQALSRQVMRMIELRTSKKQNENLMEALRVKNTSLEQFAIMAAHDLRSPVQGIHGLVHLFLTSHHDHLTDEGRTMLTGIQKTSSKLADMIQRVLEDARSEALLTERKKMVSLKELFDAVSHIFAYELRSEITFSYQVASVFVNEAALNQVLVNLVNNAIKHNPKEKALVHIEASVTADGYQFIVADNGPGIPNERREQIFQKSNCNALHAFGGMGLYTVKQLVERQNGSVRIDESKLGGIAMVIVLPFTV